MNKYIFHLFILVSCFGYSQYTQIPDSNFEQALIDQGIDSEGILDGQVLTGDIDTITTLNISSKNILDVTGIQDFIMLETLYLNNNHLINLDLSYNDNLISLIANNNLLTMLEIPLNLEVLYVEYNELTDIDYSNHPALKILSLRGNPTSSVNLENAVSLEMLDLMSDSAQIENNLNISNCTQLKELYTFAGLTSIDLSTNISLEHFEGGSCFEEPCHDFLVEIDLSNNINLLIFGYLTGTLDRLNLKNGNNEILNVSFFSDNAISCFQVDDAEAANNGTGVYASWYVQNDQEFSEDCYIGVNEFESESYTFYPNPTSYLVYSNLPSIDVDEIVIYDQQGKFIKRFSSFPIDISNFNAGFYILKIKLFDERVIYDKILKE